MKFLLFFSLFIASQSVFSIEKVFRLHLTNEPANLDPNKQKTFQSSYLLSSLYRNIYIIDDNNKLQPDLGLECRREQKKKLQCSLKKNLRWSDGSPLTSQDFLNTYYKILDPETKAPRADLLFSLKNAQDIYAGKKKNTTLGVTTPDAWTLVFEFENAAPEFEYNLASTILSPTKKDLSSFNGPFKLKEWKKGQRITLEKNDFYPGGHPRRPLVEFIFTEEDTVALQLYEKNELQFLRRLPVVFIPRYKNKKDFQWKPILRFDYVGFGPDLRKEENLRKAFIYSLNYVELQKIFNAEERPGCVGLPDAWFPQKAPCYDFDLKKIPQVSSAKEFLFLFSTQGGEDHKRATEWMQNQWQKNTQLKVRLEAKENKIFLETLTKTPPALFRKGVSPDHPTCLSALQTFAQGSAENYIRFESPEFNLLLEQLEQPLSESEAQKRCLAGVELLLRNHVFIPLGKIHFALLVKPEWVGWKLNQSNQLDLSNLHLKP